MYCTRFLSTIVIALFIGQASAQVEFPLGSEVVNVRKAPYNAKGDGKHDDTEAIQKALNDHPNGDYIIYLPHGIYKITNTITWPEAKKPEDSFKRTILQGQSIGGTIIMLKDNCQGFDNADFPSPVIMTGEGPKVKQRNSIRDLTIRTGKGNAGAIGIRFNAGIQGTISNVKVHSGDSAGVYGIDMGFTENIGPLLLKNVEVNGFGVGVYTAGTMNGMTFEHVTLGGQTKYGFMNDGQTVASGVPLESCWSTTDSAWGYNPDDPLSKMTATEIVRRLVRTRARGANLLLNVAPAPDGTIPETIRARLAEVGAWIRAHGHTVLETETAAYKVLSTVSTISPDGKKVWLHCISDANPKYGMWMQAHHRILAATNEITGEPVPFEQKERNGRSLLLMTLAIPEGVPDTIVRLDVEPFPAEP